MYTYQDPAPTPPVDSIYFEGCTETEQDPNEAEFEWQPCPHCRKMQCKCELDGLPF